REDIHCTGAAASVIQLVPIDAARTAGLKPGTDDEGIAVEGNINSEYVFHIGVGGFDIGLLGPRCPGPREHIDGAGVSACVVGLIAIDAGRTATFCRCTHCEGVSI